MLSTVKSGVLFSVQERTCTLCASDAEATMTMTSAAYEFCTNAAHFIKSSTLVFKPAEHGPVNNDDSIMLHISLNHQHWSSNLLNMDP